ncbi:MAG: LamB/YcsF family protein, partial [Firmicutes bacterium]|nr:LamB/YcsF family protein [Bacillota bacterium]
MTGVRGAGGNGCHFRRFGIVYYQERSAFAHGRYDPQDHRLQLRLRQAEDGGASDSLIIPIVTSVNVACGYHAGSPEDMRRTVRLAKASGCNIG